MSQLTLMGCGAGATGGIVPPLDVVTGSPVSYGIRKLRSAYAGSAVNIRRSSDNATQDIGFTSEGDFDISAFNTFVGGGNGFVTKWYDQSGNGNDAAQAVAGNQPQLLLNQQEGRPTVAFTRASSMVLTATAVTQAQPMSFAVVALGTTDIHSNGSVLISSDGNGKILFGKSGSNNVGATDWGGAEGDFALPDATYNETQLIINGASTSCNVNGTQVLTPQNLGGSTLSGNFVIGAGTGTFWDGNAGEILIFGSALSASQQTAIYGNQRAYWGTP